jgi:hypothetical protein
MGSVGTMMAKEMKSTVCLGMIRVKIIAIMILLSDRRPI